MADVRIKYKVDKGELVLAREELEKIEKEIGVTEKKSKGLSSEFKIVGGAIAAAFTVDKLIDFGKQVISITAEFQKLKAVLTNTLGSRSAADQAFKNIQDFASKTPFQVNQLTDSFVKLANQGFVPTTKELRKLGDLAASTGKEFDQLTEAIIDAQVGEFERLKEFGIRASKEGDKVSFTFKGVQTQTDFTSESIRDYILSLGDLAGVSGSMAAISDTLGGKLSNMQDNIDALFYAIGQQLNPVIAGAIDGINMLIGSVTDYISVPYADQLRKQQVELNTLVGALTNANTSEEARSTLIAKLNAQYPDFLKNLSAEELTNENIAKRLDDVNEQFLRKIALEAAQERLNDQQQELLDNIEKEASIRTRLVENTAKQEKAVGAERQRIAKRIGQGEDALNEAISERKAIQEGLTNQLKTYTDALDIFNSKDKDYFNNQKKKVDQEEKYKGLTKEQTEEIKARKKEEEDWLKSATDKYETYLDIQKQEDERLKGRNELIDEVVQANNDGLNQELEDQRNANLEKIKNEEETAIAIGEIRKELFYEAANSVFEIQRNFAERGIQKLEEEKERRLAIAGDDANKKAKIEEEFNKKIAEQKRKQAVSDKLQAIFNIGLSTAQAIIKSVAASPLTAGQPFAGIATAMGAIQLAGVLSRPIPKFAKGVLDLNGPGSSTSDSIHAMLSRGESVMTARETKDFLPTLRAIRENKIDPKLLNAVVSRGPSVIHSVNEVPRDVINIDENGFSKYLVTRQQKSQVLTSKYRT